MRISLRRAATIGASILAVGAFAAPAQASVTPDTTMSKCGTGTSSGNVQTCLFIDISNGRIASTQAVATVLRSQRTLQACVHGPIKSLGCSPFESVTMNHNVHFLHVQMPGDPEHGEFCANTFRQNDSGPSTQIGHECITVP